MIKLVGGFAYSMLSRFCFSRVCGTGEAFYYAVCVCAGIVMVTTCSDTVPVLIR